MSVQQLAVPTTLTLSVARRYGGVDYPRTTRVFGDREPVVLHIALINDVALPVQNAPVTVTMNGSYLATVYTDLLGGAGYLFSSGIPAGSHIIEASWAGDFWNGPSQNTLNLQTVPMVDAFFKTYVDIVAVPAGTVEAELMQNLLNQQIGAVLTRIEADLDRARYIFTVLIPTETTTQTLAPNGLIVIPAIVAQIIIAVVALLLVYSVAAYVTIVYVLGQYQCGVCGENFRTCESLREHLITIHPGEWAEIQDRFECTPPGLGGEFMIYAIVGVAALVGVGYLIQSLKR